MKTILIFAVSLFVSTSFAQEILSAKTEGPTNEGISSPQSPLPGEQRKGTGAINGTVIDQSSREPVVKARVTILGTKYSVYTSDDGQFTIDSVAEGIYQIKAEANGFEPQVMNNTYLYEGKKVDRFFVLQKIQQEPPDFVEVEQQPQPIAGNTPAPTYPELARRAGVEGTVWVKIWIDEEGSPRKAILLKSDAEVLNQTSLDTAMKWKFKPAVLKGKPVAVWVTMPFKFKLDISKTKQLKTK